MWRIRRGFGKRIRILKWVWLIIRRGARIDGRKSRQRLGQNPRRRLNDTTSCCWMMWRRSRPGRLRTRHMETRICRKAPPRRRSKSGEKLQERGLKTNIGYFCRDWRNMGREIGRAYQDTSYSRGIRPKSQVMLKSISSVKKRKIKPRKGKVFLTTPMYSSVVASKVSH